MYIDQLVEKSEGGPFEAGARDRLARLVEEKKIVFSFLGELKYSAFE
jgi:hypothetical protein